MPDPHPIPGQPTSPSARRGLFLTFEGPDGSGKTTQLHRLAATLRAAGLTVLTTRQPGGTPLGDSLRSLLVSSPIHAPIDPLAELALMFADRAQSLATVILPALASGTTVLCDRFTDSTVAYQAFGRQLGTDPILTLHDTLCAGIEPDRTVLLLPPVAVSLARARDRNLAHQQQTGVDENRFEREGLAFFERVSQGYENLAHAHPERILCIRGDDSIDAIEAQIASHLAPLFPDVLRP